VNFISELLQRLRGLFDPLQQAPDVLSNVDAIFDRTKDIHRDSNLDDLVRSMTTWEKADEMHLTSATLSSMRLTAGLPRLHRCTRAQVHDIDEDLITESHEVE